MHASLSPEAHSIIKPPLSHGCGDIFCLIWTNVKRQREKYFKSEWIYAEHQYILDRFNSPLGHTPWEAAWLPCFQTSWPHMQESLVLPLAEPSQPLHPSCWPESRQWDRKTGAQVDKVVKWGQLVHILKSLYEERLGDYQDSVKGRRGSTSLYMTQDCSAGVKA